MHLRVVHNEIIGPYVIDGDGWIKGDPNTPGKFRVITEYEDAPADAVKKERALTRSNGGELPPDQLARAKRYAARKASWS